MFESLIPIDGLVVLSSLIVCAIISKRKANNYNTFKLRNKIHYQWDMGVCNKLYNRSKTVLVAITSTGSKVYMKQHNM